MAVQKAYNRLNLVKGSRVMPKKVVKPVAKPNLQPPLALLVKLGSVAVHAEELLSPFGHQFDRTALETLLKDAELQAWVKEMGAFLPRKRN